MNNRTVIINTPYGNPRSITFDLQLVLGNGTFSDVYRGTDNSHDSLAIKILKINNTNKNLDDVKCNYELEKRIMEAVSEGENLVQIYGHFNDSEIGYGIVMPYAGNGILTDWLDEKNKSLGNLQFPLIFGIAHGIKYLHEKNIVHRDLKPDNILLDNNMYPRVTDFGLACDANALNDPDMEVKGTPLYYAPEVVTALTTQSFASDMFSFYLIAWDILANKKDPYSTMNLKNLYHLDHLLNIKKYRENIPNHYSNRIKNLMIECGDAEPKRRPTAENACKVLEVEIQEQGLKKLAAVSPSLTNTGFFSHTNEITKRAATSENICLVHVQKQIF